MLYQEVITKVGNKLTAPELSVIKGILILNLCHFSFRDKEDALYALRQCVDLSKEDLEGVLRTLEHSHGVIAYDDNANTFDLLAEASGFNEFKLIFKRYYDSSNTSIVQCDEALLTELGVTRPIETPFAQKNQISSMEWCFEQKLMDPSAITESYLSSLLRQQALARNGESPRGNFLFAYCPEGADQEILRLSQLYRELNLRRHPVLLLFLRGEEKELVTALNTKLAIEKFSPSEVSRFQQ